MHTRIPVALTTDKAGETVKLAGWVQTRRDHGKLIFFDLRDRSGLLQCVVKEGEASYETAKELRAEYVVEIVGEVKERPTNLQNPELATGTVELKVSELTILNEADTPPFEINSGGEVSEELRMKYRYLDLRNDRPKHNLEFRHRMVKYMRDYFDGQGFWEIETPYLTKGTPEGAREFVIPSRHHPGKFYVLPQSPQQFKQLLMVGGVERYFQIARIFRDEDPRADRAFGEATQLDVEISFASQAELLVLIEDLLVGLVKELLPQKHIQEVPFPRIPYDEAMAKYGSDKPDLRQDTSDPNELAFAFIVDWPAFEWNEERKAWDPHHHIFTAPRTEDVSLLDSDPAKVRSWQHDLVLNGYEIGGGSIRITDPTVQEKVFNLVGIPEEEGQSKFQHMLEAFRYGVPPHGGIAIGVDRILIPFLGEPNLREVVAFSKTGDGRDLMMGAPSPLPEELLREVHIKPISPEKE